MGIISFLMGKTKEIGIGIAGFFSLYLLGRNSKLSKENARLNLDNQGKEKIIETQKKVIDVAKNTKPSNIAGNIQRMRKDKL